jgi:hypothetical protein
MACTVIGISPCPVINTIGMCTSLFPICSWKASPLSPRSLTSRIRQLGAPHFAKARKSPDVSNVSTRSPTDFGKEDFIYNAKTNEYRCPASERFIWRFSTVERGLKLSKYWSSNCQQCSLKGDCTPGPQRRVARSNHEAVLDEMQAGLDHAPEMMRIRRQTVEHPFGTIKAWMGATHLLTRTIERVSTEMCLHVLAYNMKRVIKLLGSETLMKAMRA